MIIETITILIVLLALAVYVFFSYSLQTIAKRTRIKKGWLAWIPIANYYLMIKIAKKPIWWILFLMLPMIYVSIINPIIDLLISMTGAIFFVLVWAAISVKRKKSKWLGVLMIIPIANLITLGYLAYSK